MNHHQFKEFLVEMQVRLILAALALMGLASVLALVVVILRWAGVPC